MSPLTHSPVHLADVILYQASVEVNKESPGGLCALSEVIGDGFKDARELDALLNVTRELVG